MALPAHGRIFTTCQSARWTRRDAAMALDGNVAQEASFKQEYGGKTKRRINSERL
jgi:hypothetical protein